MKHLSIAILASSCLVGCAGMVTANDGERVTVEHGGEASVDRARGVAVESCRQVGKTDAQHVTTVSKNPALPVGTGVQLSTFRCV